MREKLENVTSFLWVDLSSTLILKENSVSPKCTENVLRTELFKNSDIMISLSEFSSNPNLKWWMIVAFSIFLGVGMGP